MDIEELARWAGVERFRRACRQAHRLGPGTGRSPVPSSADDADLAHELSDLVAGDLGLAIALHRAMPCYANLMYVDDWAPRPDLLARLATVLDEPDDAVADPVSYWLWCGPFEEEESASGAAFRQLTEGASDLRLRRLLPVSGPVPWAAKAPVFEGLVRETRWHPALWRAVGAAARDYFGRVDSRGALCLLDRLGDPPGDLAGVDLRRQLESQ